MCTLGFIYSNKYSKKYAETTELYVLYNKLKFGYGVVEIFPERKRGMETFFDFFVTF